MGRQGSVWFTYSPLCLADHFRGAWRRLSIAAGGRDVTHGLAHGVRELLQINTPPAAGSGATMDGSAL
jgi:hypothetical protein